MRGCPWVPSSRGLVITLLCLMLPDYVSGQQPSTIGGRVTAGGGAPLGGAVVVVEGAGLGTLTEADGTYQLVVPAARFQGGQILRVTAQMIGYRSETRDVRLSSGVAVEQIFALALDPLRLDEIVVTGAGLAMRAERLGTARATVDVQMIARTNEPNVVAGLALKAPNVITTQSSGKPGAGTSIRIRGTATFAGLGQPLIVVDGVPINNEARAFSNSRTVNALGANVTTNRAFDLNPDDIESVEILKGPSATSIFGASAGAGGAILITTRRGRPGVTRYTLRSSLQLDQVTRLIPLQRRFSSGTGGNPNSCLVDPTPGCTHNLPAWGPPLAAGMPTYDHAGELYETGALLDHTLTVSGGSEETRFYLSLGALDHDGFIATDHDRYQRYSVRMNADHQLRFDLRVGGSMSYVQTKGEFVGRGNNANSLLLGGLRTPPEFDSRAYLDPIHGLHRSYRFPAPRAQDFVNPARGLDNPFFAINENPNVGEVGRFLGNIHWNWVPLAWLELNHTVGFDHASDDRTDALHHSSAGPGSGGAVSRWQFYDRILDHTLTVRASRRIDELVTGAISLGQNLNEKSFRQIQVDGQRLIAPLPYKLQNTVDRSPPTDAEETRCLEGYFGQVELDLYGQLFLTGSLRNDAGSTFGRNSKRAWYPGGQLAWTFTEGFDELPGAVTFGKLRITYGESGQEPGVYQLQDIFTNAGIDDSNPGSIIVPTLGGFGGLYTSGTRGNPNLKPERVREIEAGVDVSLFDGRSDLSLTYYDQHASDIIFGVELPPSSGAAQVVLNAGEVENRGWEAILNLRPIQRQNLWLNLGVNWARNTSEVTSLGDIGTDAQGNPNSANGDRVELRFLRQHHPLAGWAAGRDLPGLRLGQVRHGHRDPRLRDGGSLPGGSRGRCVPGPGRCSGGRSRRARHR